MGDQQELCLAAAQRGEECCRQGNVTEGINYLERAVSHGSSDVYLLSALYSQLGNAYYVLGNYEMAMEYHSYDLLLCRAMHDNPGQASAFSNLAIVRTAEKAFDDAIKYADCQMGIAKKLDDKGLLSRAYYTKGYIYFQRAKNSAPRAEDAIMMFPVPTVTTTLPDDTKDDVYTAIDAFMQNAALANELQDPTCAALAYSNLGMAYFMLEEYQLACQYHEKRLEVARSLSDKPGMRRALTNLGNSYFFTSEFGKAIECYSQAVQVASEMSDRQLQAQAWFSIGITATIEGQLEEGARAHLKHLQISRELGNLSAQARSCSSLASIYCVLKDVPKALYFLVIRYKLAVEMRDHEMELKTRSGIRITVQSDPQSVVKDGNRVLLDSSADPDIDAVLEAMRSSNTSVSSQSPPPASTAHLPPIDASGIGFALRDDSRTASAPNLCDALSTYIVDCANGVNPRNLTSLPVREAPVQNDGGALYATPPLARSMPNVKTPGQDTDFLDMIANIQSRRIDDQRCDPTIIMKDLTNTSLDRHVDTHSASASRLSGTSRRLSTFSSMIFKKTRRSKRSKNKAMTMMTTSTPATASAGGGRPQSMDCSYLSDIKATPSAKAPVTKKTAAISSFSEMSTVSTPEGSVVFAVPELPKRRQPSGRSLALDKENLNLAASTGIARSVSEQHLHRGRNDSASISCASELSYIDEDGSLSQATATTADTYVNTNDKTLRNAGFYNPEAILDLIASIQSRRMDEQRADLILPGLRDRHSFLERFSKEIRRKQMVSSEQLVDEKLYDLILQCQSDRIEEQRSHLGGRERDRSTQSLGPERTAIPEEDVHNIVLRMQAGRLEEQRADLKALNEKTSAPSGK